MIGGEESRDVDGDGIIDLHQGRQPMPDQDVRRGLGAHVRVVAHLQGLGQEREHLDRVARADHLVEHRGDGVPQELEPLDVVSFPPGMIRRFENVTTGDPNEESILMFVIGGDAPRAEFTDHAMRQLEAAGVWSPRS